MILFYPKVRLNSTVLLPREYSSCAHRPNDQAHPPPEAGAKGGTTKAQAVGGRVQRLVVPLLLAVWPPFDEFDDGWRFDSYQCADNCAARNRQNERREYHKRTDTNFFLIWKYQR